MYGRPRRSRHRRGQTFTCASSRACRASASCACRLDSLPAPLLAPACAADGERLLAPLLRAAGVPLGRAASRCSVLRTRTPYR